MFFNGFLRVLPCQEVDETIKCVAQVYEWHNVPTLDSVELPGSSTRCRLMSGFLVCFWRVLSVE
jgi:hypothetical protein